MNMKRLIHWLKGYDFPFYLGHACAMTIGTMCVGVAIGAMIYGA
jgi:hypothetical protein